MTKELSFFDYINIISKRKKLIVFIIIITVIVAFAGTLIAPKKYISQATIMPIASAGGTLASLLKTTPFGSPVEQNARTILVILSSRSIAGDVVQKLGLVSEFKLSESKDGRFKSIKKLGKSIMRFSVTKDGAINIYAETDSPTLSSKIVAAYIDSLTQFLNKNSISTTFTVIDKPEIPYTHDKPSIKLNLFIAFIASLMLSFSFALFLEHKEKVL